MDKRAGILKFCIGLEEKMQGYVALIALRRGMTNLIPLLMMGSFALLATSFPISGYQQWMEAIFGNRWMAFFQQLYGSTFGMLALFSTISISYAYASECRSRCQLEMNPLLASAVGVISLLAISGIHSGNNITLDRLGSFGVFGAIAASLIATPIYIKILQVVRNRKPFVLGNDFFYEIALWGFFPLVITLVLLSGIDSLTRGFGYSDLFSMVSTGMFHMFTGVSDELTQGLAFITSVHGLWFIGVHGSNVLEPISRQVLIPAEAVNHALFLAGQPPEKIITKTFFDVFVLMGGCGSSLALVCSLLIFGTQKNGTRLASLAILPVLFNINELVVFGLPIVMNPILLIPFVGVPVVMTLTAWGATAFGFVPATIQTVTWTTPVFLSGYLATGSIWGSVLQLFNLLLGIVLYAPFVKAADQVAQERMQKDLNRLTETALEADMGAPLLTRQDYVGNTARLLASELNQAVKNQALMLHYQPQVHSDGTIEGVEALLRWKHPTYGSVNPLLIIRLSEELKIMDTLGAWVLKTAVNDLVRLEKRGFEVSIVAVNVSASQLKTEGFHEIVARTLNRSGVLPCRLVVEITERVALTQSPLVLKNIAGLKDLGVSMSMDDFGMGHSSLMYLKQYQFDEIKLDGSLVREMVSNSSCQSIIRSIVELGNQLNYSVIAEFVETEEQRRQLQKLGCFRYQGYLYSPALPLEELVEFFQKHENIER